MDKRLLLEKLGLARETGNESLFLELLEDIYADSHENLEDIMEINDAVLDALEEFGWLDRMIEFAADMVRQDPSNAQRKAELGGYYYKKGYMDKAEIFLVSSLELKENPIARFYLNKIYESHQ